MKERCIHGFFKGYCYFTGCLHSLSGSESPRTDGYVLMPTALTAENGAKAALIGEFSVPFPITCPACQGDYEEYCEECVNTGEVKLNVNVPWTVIKEIYTRVVKHFGA